MKQYSNYHQFTRVGTDDATYTVGRLKLRNVHQASECQGQSCIIHNPSDHSMRTWALNWRGDRHLWERLCPTHGIGHPDPDDLAWHESQGRMYMEVHGCCGCENYFEETP